MKIVCVFERGSRAFPSCPAEEEVWWLLEASVSVREMRRSWQPGRDEGYLQLLSMPSGAPIPVPDTCYPAFCGVSISILESWWAEFWSGLEAMVGRPVWPLMLLLVYEITNFPGARWTPRLIGWERLAWIDPCF